MRTIKTFLLLSLISLSVTATAETKADDLLGYWLSEGDDAVIKIEQKDEEFQGDMVWLKSVHTGEVKEKLDAKNPDEEKRSRNLIGLTILEGFKYKDGRWTGGTIYDAKSGKTYSAKMKLDDKETLNLRGYIGISLFGRTSKWTRQDGMVPKKYLKN